MQDPTSISFINSVLGGASIGLISGLFGALVRALMLWRVPALPALIAGIFAGVTPGVLLLQASEISTTTALLTSAIIGGMVPVTSALRFFVSSPESDSESIHADDN